MKYIHHITITAFVTEKEDKEDIKTVLEEVLPEELKEEDISREEEIVRIDETTKMTILRLRCLKEKDTKLIVKKLKELLGKKQIKKIVEETNRIDDEGRLYIRLEKEAMINKGEAILTDSGHCIHFKILLAAYPKNKDRAISVCKELFS